MDDNCATLKKIYIYIHNLLYWKKALSYNEFTRNISENCQGNWEHGFLPEM